MKPVRIQRRRTKGWRMPSNAVYVGRGTCWGNPYDNAPNDLLVALFRDMMKGDSRRAEVARARLPELRGKNLACYCSLAEPCHADVLLELANA